MQFPKTKTPLVIAFSIATLTMTAETLTPEQALSRMNLSANTRTEQISPASLTLNYTMQTKDGAPALYIFNNKNGNGFVVLSADDVAAPVLGYSNDGTFDITKVSPTTKWWLSQYTSQIFEASTIVSETGIATRSSLPTRVSGGAIAPMTSTKWNQSEPFNEQCPEKDGKRCVTGCVATALAQVMKYHGYPQKGSGTVKIKFDDAEQSLDLSAQSFDWDNMLDTYTKGKYTQTQANAVAYLTKACGYSVEMSYGPEESGAVSHRLGKALIDNFGYNKYITYEKRTNYSATDWNQMVYDELAAKRPVLYGGQSNSGGHEFVCDGYDGNGYFHINWGWGGMSDGYFLLESLNPADLGIGGGSGGGFSFDQDIIKGVQPTDLADSFVPNMIQGGSISCTNNGSKITMEAGWWNYTYQTLKLNFGVIIESTDGKYKNEVECTGAVSFTPLTGYQKLSFTFPSKMTSGTSSVTTPDGKYKVTVATCSDTKANPAKWIPVEHPLNAANYFYVTKDASKYTIETVADKDLTLESGDLASGLYYNQATKISLSVANESDIELTQTVEPVLMNGDDVWFVGDGMPMTLNPGQKYSTEFVTTFTKEDNASAITAATSLTLRFRNAGSKVYYSFSKAVTMNPAPKISVKSSAPVIKNATAVKENGRTIYEVPDLSNFTLTADITCDGDYFGSSIFAFLFPITGGTSLIGVEAVPIPTLSKGQSQNIEAVFHYGHGEEGSNYFIRLYYIDSDYEEIGNGLCFIRQKSAGIDDLETSAGLSISFDLYTGTVSVSSTSTITSFEIYDISGKRVASIPAGYSSSEAILQTEGIKGVAVATVRDANGNIKTLKFEK